MGCQLQLVLWNFAHYGQIYFPTKVDAKYLYEYKDRMDCFCKACSTNSTLKIIIIFHISVSAFQIQQWFLLHWTIFAARAKLRVVGTPFPSHELRELRKKNGIQFMNSKVVLLCLSIVRMGFSTYGVMVCILTWVFSKKSIIKDSVPMVALLGDEPLGNMPWERIWEMPPTLCS